METGTSGYGRKPFAVVLAAVVVLEALSAKCPDPLIAVGIARALEAGFIIWAAKMFFPAAALPGIVPVSALRGLVRGMLWSAGFGAAAAAAGLVLYAAGLDPFSMIRVSLPRSPERLALFLAVGGLVSPFAEELFFRGALFGLLRRWGALPAILGSALVFAAAHGGGGMPVIQAAGGLVFALSYEAEKNILVPVVIHCSGNLALFTLSMT
ncbi:MAG: CPBP family intramembrane glutamic endopeptidase [Desulfosalsimonas sp.]